METTIPRFIKLPKQSFFLFGPRGTGKTTWLKVNYPRATFINLLEADVFRAFSVHPERLRELVLSDPFKKHVVIDEIQMRGHANKAGSSAEICEKAVFGLGAEAVHAFETQGDCRKN